MIEISRFNFTRDTADDILVVPAIIEETINNLYEVTNGAENLVDFTLFTREACKNLVTIPAP